MVVENALMVPMEVLGDQATSAMVGMVGMEENMEAGAMVVVAMDPVYMVASGIKVATEVTKVDI